MPEDFAEMVDLYNSNKDMPIDSFIISMMHTSGKWYSNENFTEEEPGTTYEYSNMGAAIAGYIIEIVTGKTYMEYTRETILEPLGMSHTGWTHEEINKDQFVSLYLSNNKRIPHYALISYADGGLITSVNDLALYFSAMIKGYKGTSSKILSEASYQKMMNPIFISEEKDSGFFGM